MSTIKKTYVSALLRMSDKALFRKKIQKLKADVLMLIFKEALGLWDT